MYTDDSIMPRGKFKFWKLKNIPPSYFINIWDTSKGGGDMELRQWIEANLERLKSLPPNIGTPPPEVSFVCEKFTYPTEAEAKFKLKHIRKDQRDHKKPYRAYECPDCSGWHLTSKDDYKFTNKLK